MSTKIPITVLISGSGTNLQALIDHHQRNPDACPYIITRVISNKKDAYGLTRAANAGIPTLYHNIIAGGYKKKYPEDMDKRREEYDVDLAKLVLADRPSLVVCAGWMHILSKAFLERLKEGGVEIVNLHPALPGKYNGAKAIERAHADFMIGKTDETGVMIHYVIDEVDMGDPIVVERIALKHPNDDDIEALENRIHKIEHEAIVKGTLIAIEKLQN